MAAPATLSDLLTSLTQSITSTLEATPKLETFDRPKDGISLLDVKNELLLSYLQNLVFLILVKLRNSKPQSDQGDDSGDELDESVRAKLVELRLFLEKGARPLEEKLRFSIERFIRLADDAQREKESTAKKSKSRAKSGNSDSESDSQSDSEDEESDNEEAKMAPRRRPGDMSAAPNFSTMRDDVTARPAQREDGPAGVYRPPKRDRHTMETTQRREKTDRRPHRSHTMEEFVNSELSAAPLSEPSIGTTIVQGGRKMKTAGERKDEDERREYEETNYTRLPAQSKKDKANKAKQAGRSGRMQFGGEEWHNLGEGVDRIDRLTKGKGGGRGGNVRAMLEQSRKRGPDTSDGPRGSGHGPEIGERFQKRVKLLEGGRRDRGKNR